MDKIMMPDPIVHIIDGNADPFTPNGWSIEKHEKCGLMKLEGRGDDLYLNEKKIVLFLSKKQQWGKHAVGHELREELSGKKVLNGNVLDYLIAHCELIPESWKKDENGNIRYIFFWGTIYISSSGGLCVRYLDLDGRWSRDYDWLGRDWGGHSPAALCVS